VSAHPRFLLAIAASIVAACTATSLRAEEFAFAHPGLLHSREDLAHIHRAVAEQQQPIFAGFEKLRAHAASQASYRMLGPGDEIGRLPSVNHHEYDSDANACYQNALMWCITGERAFAEKAKEILNAWSRTLKRVSGADAVLMAGLGPFKMINAAELLRYTDAGWTEADVAQAERMFKEAIYPTLRDFAPFANGNWDTAAVKTVLAIGVFCNDREIFERALRYYVAGSGDGRLTHYIINETGQCQESGRDMGHTQLGLAHLGDASEIAWHQGLDLYGAADNRLLKGFEYTARYTLGEDVPFAETRDRTGKYHHTRISTIGRGTVRPVFEEIYHHYVSRVGLAAPWTQRAAEKIRPEGESRPGADHIGFGTLLFTRASDPTVDSSAAAILAAPAAVIATGGDKYVQLSWVAPIGATSYTIRRANAARATEAREHFKTIASDIRTATFTDDTVKTGEIYRYVVTAKNARGESATSTPLAICAGLPSRWEAADIGAIDAVGATQFDGDVFTLEASGSGIGGSADSFRFTHTPLARDGAIVARFVPQVSSQFSQFGVTIRGATDADAPHVTLVFAPEKSEDNERPHWSAKLLARSTAGAETTMIGSLRLEAPIVTFGRFVQPYWLRLERHGGRFIALTSMDGAKWTELGSANAALGREAHVGLLACSRAQAVTTTVRFDHVAVTARQP
jgi:hypothetical protein